MCGRRLDIAIKSIIPLLFLVAISCKSGPRTGKVEGKVTFEGKAVTEGFVNFLNPTEGGSAEAALKEDGSFVVNEPVVVGDYIVIIRPPSQILDTDPGKSPPAPVDKPASNIPERYRQQGTTTLKAKVNEGKNVIELNMTKAP